MRIELGTSHLLWMFQHKRNKRIYRLQTVKKNLFLTLPLAMHVIMAKHTKSFLKVSQLVISRDKHSQINVLNFYPLVFTLVYFSVTKR